MNIDEQLQLFRDKINALDQSLIETLAERMAICLQVGHFKKEHGIAMMQPGRVEAVKARCAEIGGELNLRPEFVLNLYHLIIQEACELETIIIELKG
ncbi:chorismate mutase [Bradyrhizobium sp. BRP14]|nr:chorismate mutase [Bradyrhizobium sp. BRP14]